MATLARTAFARRSTGILQDFLARRVPLLLLWRALLGWLAIDALLLCRFIGLEWAWIAGGWLLLCAAMLWLNPFRSSSRAPTVATLLACLALAFALMLLGGQGGIFHANLDWQVRDAVLRDMRINVWPFVYASGDMLRAPLGMYLAPALIGKALGQAGADLAMLVQNSVLLAIVLAMGSTLFEQGRGRLIALITFLSFSGLDILGQIAVGHTSGIAPAAHLEGWGPTQFSSTITLAFWVPQHAIAGWLGAVGFMLWRTRRMRIGALLALPILLALWSPLPGIGLLPFIAYAGCHDLVKRRITAEDIALPAMAALIALPTLIYLAAAGDQVGMRIYPMQPVHYLLFETLEAFPFLLIAIAGWRARFGGAVLLISAALLAALPLLQIGWSVDLAMRGSIPALTILSVHLADLLAGGWTASTRRKVILIALLAIGGATGAAEIVRALTYPVSPPPRCGFARAWDETFAAWPKNSYLAPLDRVSRIIRPAAPVTVPADDTTTACFEHPWPRPPLF